jgi:hypothetical protein
MLTAYRLGRNGPKSALRNWIQTAASFRAEPVYVPRVGVWPDRQPVRGVREPGRTTALIVAGPGLFQPFS